MKIYSKKLNSLEELKREKQVLLYAKKHTASQDLFSTEGLLPKFGKPSANTTTDGESPLAGIAAMASKLMQGGAPGGVALSLALPLLKTVGLRAGKGIGLKLGKEVLGGYLKWKLIHFGITTVTGILRSRKEKKKSRNK